MLGSSGLVEVSGELGQPFSASFWRQRGQRHKVEQLELDFLAKFLDCIQGRGCGCRTTVQKCK